MVVVTVGLILARPDLGAKGDDDPDRADHPDHADHAFGQGGHGGHGGQRGHSLPPNGRLWRLAEGVAVGRLCDLPNHDLSVWRHLSLSVESWLSGWEPTIGMVSVGVSTRRWRRKYGRFRDGARISRSRSGTVLYGIPELIPETIVSICD